MVINVGEWNQLNKKEKLQMILDAAVINYLKINSPNK